MILTLLLACRSTGDTATAPDVSVPEGLDLDALFYWASQLDDATAGPWAFHWDGLAKAEQGCPQLYVGPPDAAEGLEGGAGWSDDCVTSAGWSFDGWAWWDVETLSEHDAELGTSRLEARRSLAGDLLISHEDRAFGLIGQGEDTLTLTSEDGVPTTTYEAQADLIVQEWSDRMPSRRQVTVSARWADTWSMTVRGEYYGPEWLDTYGFDGAIVDATWEADDGTTCASEPRGYYSVRAEDGVWYTLVYSPTEDGDYAAVEDTDCDTCGTLFIGGVEDGPLCPGISRDAYEQDGGGPVLYDYALSLHGSDARSG